MPEPPVRRNTILLSASLAANSAMLQLSAAVATLTVVLVVGVRSLVGLGPAIVLGTGALSALPAGRAMDRFGRVPVLVTGFALGWPGQRHGVLWISGDTVVFEGVREVGRRLTVGTALLHLGGVGFPVTGPLRYTMTAAGAAYGRATRAQARRIGLTAKSPIAASMASQGNTGSA